MIKQKFWENIDKTCQYNNPYLAYDPSMEQLSPIFTFTYWTPPTAPQHGEEVEDARDNKEEQKQTQK